MNCNENMIRSKKPKTLLLLFYAKCLFFARYLKCKNYQVCPNSLHALFMAILASKLSTQLKTKSTGPPLKLPLLILKHKID